MEINPNKFHTLLSNTKDIEINICNEKISNSYSKKLLGVTINSKLRFEELVEDLYKRESGNVSALANVSSLMNFEQRKLILNSFVTFHFSYCSMVWRFHCRRLNNKIKTTYEWALKLIYHNNTFSFRRLLPKGSSLKIHQINLQKLVTEI